MFKHNLAKFSQNEHLRQALFATGNRSMVEASPSDTIWGIGLHENAARRQEPERWPGLNLLGQVLDRVREKLREEEEEERLTEEINQEEEARLEVVNKNKGADVERVN